MPDDDVAKKPELLWNKVHESTQESVVMDDSTRISLNIAVVSTQSR